MTDARIDNVLDFWFDDCYDDAERIGARMEFWFGSSSDLDATICEVFGDIVEQASSGELDAWGETARGRLALIIVLDQLRRNVHRGEPAAFEKDPAAEA